MSLRCEVFGDYRGRTYVATWYSDFVRTGCLFVWARGQNCKLAFARNNCVSIANAGHYSEAKNNQVST